MNDHIVVVSAIDKERFRINTGVVVGPCSKEEAVNALMTLTNAYPDRIYNLAKLILD